MDEWFMRATAAASSRIGAGPGVTCGGDVLLQSLVRGVGREPSGDRTLEERAHASVRVVTSYPKLSAAALRVRQTALLWQHKAGPALSR